MSQSWTGVEPNGSRQRETSSYDATIRGKERWRWGFSFHISGGLMCSALYGGEELGPFISSLGSEQGKHVAEAYGSWGCT